MNRNNGTKFIVLIWFVFVATLAESVWLRRTRNGLVTRINWFMQATHTGHSAMHSRWRVQKNFWVNKNLLFHWKFNIKLAKKRDFSCTTTRKSHTSRWISAGDVRSASEWDMEESIPQSNFSCLECGSAHPISDPLYRRRRLLLRHWRIRNDQCAWYVCVMCENPIEAFI